MLLTALLLGALSASANAFALLPRLASSCTTVYTNNKNGQGCPVRTSSVTVGCTLPWPVLVTATSTPAPVTTITLSFIHSTATASTSTFTATSRLVVPKFTWTTVSITSTTLASSIVTSTPLSTITSTAGFIPVRSSLPTGNSYAGSDKKAAKRDEPILKERDLASGRCDYIQCYVTSTRPCVTSTYHITTTTVLPVKTFTELYTVILTDTIHPSATTTVKVRSTIIVGATTVTTFTASSTTTLTHTAAPTSYYEMCAEENMADTFKTELIHGIYIDRNPYSDYAGSVQTSAYDCCVAAYIHDRDSEPVGVWNFNPPTQARLRPDQNCNVYINRAAPPKINGVGDALYNMGLPQGVVGNGYHGELSLLITSN